MTVWTPTLLILQRLQKVLRCRSAYDLSMRSSLFLIKVLHINLNLKCAVVFEEYIAFLKI